jgi:hypothetical protein
VSVARMTEGERQLWARASTTAGWLFLLGYLAIVAVQIDRARRITTASFDDGVWGERIEVVSFVAVPQQMTVLAPAAIAAVGATLFAAGTLAEVEPWIDRLVLFVAGTAIAATVAAIVGVIAVVAREGDPSWDFGDLVSRLGGIAIGIGIVRLCLAAQRASAPPRAHDD